MLLSGFRRPVAAFSVVQSTSAADARPDLTVVERGLILRQREISKPRNWPNSRTDCEGLLRGQSFAFVDGRNSDGSAPKPDIGLETDHTAAKPVSGSRRRVLPAAGARVLLWWIGPARSRLQ